MTTKHYTFSNEPLSITEMHEVIDSIDFRIKKMNSGIAPLDIIFESSSVEEYEKKFISFYNSIPHIEELSILKKYDDTDENKSVILKATGSDEQYQDIFKYLDVNGYLIN
ncbi:hypothetical protein A5881_003848 [Enterococcus termitis]|nr:hypothetical protein A5881_003765 [Enterococcus termitis]